MKLIEDFKNFLLEAPRDGNKKGYITQNTASNYFSTFKTVLKQAFVDGYLTIDLSAKTKRIRKLDTRRETLTLEEINLLVNTECDKPIIKQGALFSLLTGLRHCDVKKLRWGELQKIGDKYFWPLSYSSAKTAQKRMDKLEKAGIRCKLTGYNGGCIEFLGYTPETEALLEKERQEVIIAHK